MSQMTRAVFAGSHDAGVSTAFQPWTAGPTCSLARRESFRGSAAFAATVTSSAESQTERVNQDIQESPLQEPSMHAF